MGTFSACLHTTRILTLESFLDTSIVIIAIDLIADLAKI